MTNLWQHSCAETLDSHRLTGEVTVDLAILGGGFTGCAAALHAREQGADVALLEALEIGHGGSGRNVGLVNAGLWLPPDEVEALMGVAAGQRLNAALAQGPDTVFSLIERFGINCEPVRSGTLHCAHAPRGMKDLRNRYAQAKARNAPVHLLDTDAAQSATGSKNVYGALQDDRAGTIQPLGYVKGLARAAQQLGAQIYQHSPALDIHHDGAVWRITTPKGQLRAKKLLIATNAYGALAAKKLTCSTAQVHFFQLATQPLPETVLQKILPQKQGCWDTGLIMKSFRRDAAGRFIFGAMGRPDLLGIHRNWALRVLATLYPDLASYSLDYFWSGAIAMTKDHLPKVRSIGPQGFEIFGYSGRGIAPGTVLGTAVAEALLTGSTEALPLAPVSSYRDPIGLMRSTYCEAGSRAFHFISNR